MKFLPVYADADISTLAALADEIWHEYWPGLIGLAQTDYMVEKYQSEQVLAQAIKQEGYRYYILMDEERVVGYTGARIEEEERRLFLSKLYVLSAERGKGFAAETMRFYSTLCQENSLTAIYLTVNKDNALAIGAYQSMGFEIVESVINDIGEGFVMDDYIMEKRMSHTG